MHGQRAPAARLSWEAQADRVWAHILKRECCFEAKNADLVLWMVAWTRNRLYREAIESPSWIILLLLSLAVCGVGWSLPEVQVDPLHCCLKYRQSLLWHHCLFPQFFSSESFSSPKFISWNKIPYNIFYSQASNLVMLSSSIKAVGELYF